jgi:hypothetical protein
MFARLKARVYSDETGAYAELPVLLTPAGILEPLLDYFLTRDHDRSREWMGKVLRSVTLFLEYLLSNPQERESYLLFQSFAQRLYTGSFDRETGLDPSGLAWSARSSLDAGHIVTHLSDFFGWLGNAQPAAAIINPRYANGAFDRMCDEAAYQFRRDKAFLGHTWANNARTVARGFTRPRRALKIEAEKPPAFPEGRFNEFLLEGFRFGCRYDYRGMLITLLLHGAGFRASEPFHLYIEDAFRDPRNSQRAIVLIHHPSQGAAPAEWRDAHGKVRRGNRAAYLTEKWGLVPRDQLLDSRHAGWKGGTHDAAYYKRAHWFVPEYGEHFWDLWRRYLEEVVRVQRRHPYAFVNLSREPKGGMYCLRQYNKAHAAACKRIGLEVSKSLGTTPHGHRHAYARRLRDAGIAPEHRRRFMHHTAIESQETYTTYTTNETRAAMTEAAQRLQSALMVSSAKNNVPHGDDATTSADG